MCCDIFVVVVIAALKRDCYMAVEREKIQLEHNSKLMTIDVTEGYIKLGNKDNLRMMKLGKREAAILRFFLKHENEVVSKDELLEHAWKETIVCENSVVVAVSNLRRLFRKIDEDCCCLKTISGKGYIFSAAESGFLKKITH